VKEAFGLVLVESLACGTPIVALADGGGPAEIVQEGVGFRSGETPAALADACAAAIDLVTFPNTTTACRDAAAAYDWRTAIVPQLERIYG
jgi:glycosyltransferase involved in cell wall biosynthesis